MATCEQKFPANLRDMIVEMQQCFLVRERIRIVDRATIGTSQDIRRRTVAEFRP